MSGSTLFEDCLIYENRAESTAVGGFFGGYGGGGGGLVLGGYGAPTLRHCEIHHNVVTATSSAIGGGVIVFPGANAVIEADTLIHDNVVTASVGAHGGGAAIYSPLGMAEAVVRDSQVTSNTCFAPTGTGLGGGVGVLISRAVISDSLIAGNVISAAAAWGGGVAGIGLTVGGQTSTATGRFDGNVIRDNLAQGSGDGARGGGLLLLGMSAGDAISVTNNLVFDNRATDPFTGSMGGGICTVDVSPTMYLVNNTVVSNATTGAPGWGGGVYLDGGVLSNTIVASNRASDYGGGVYVTGTVSSADYNDVWNNTCNGGANCGANYSGTVTSPPPNDINLDPHFVGAGAPAAFYHLQASSPCINEGFGPGGGVPGRDYDDDARPQDLDWDIGFDERGVGGTPVFTITKRTSANPVAGAPLTYTLTVTNTGNGDSTGVVISDAVPLDAHYVSGGSYAGGVVSWTVGSIVAHGGPEQVSFAVTTCQTTITNTWYRVVTSTQGVSSTWGAALTTHLSAPAINPDFDYASAAPAVDQTVNFDDATTTDGGLIIDWSWDFGDGDTDSGASVSHVYTATGVYTVKLVVTDTCEYSATVERVVNVGEAQPVGGVTLLFTAGSPPIYLPTILRPVP